MIKVDSILKDNARNAAKKAKENEEVIKTGSNSLAKKNPWPWVIGAIILAVIAWLLLKKKDNEGIPG
jgi:hypothetical protein